MDESLRLRFGMAELHFEQRRYREAAELLESVVAEAPDNASARTLLARSFFHAAMLARAEHEARQIVERWPVDAYAHVILARSLQRQSRHDEALPHLRLAAALTGDEDLVP
jgi:tetratricopeptide (TPR) repeat protein